MMDNNRDMRQQLEDIRVWDERIQGKLSRLEQMRASLGSVRAADCSRVFVRTCAAADALGDRLAQIDALEREIDRDIDWFADCKNQALHLLGQLGDIRQRQVLYARYFRYLSFRRIAAELGMGKDCVFRLHRRGLEQLNAMAQERRCGQKS